MTALIFYGGAGEIGGNKVLLEDGEKRLFLDFGFPFSRYQEFYEEYLKPRAGAGLLDPLAMGLLPPLEGIYRPDLELPGLWERFRGQPGYRKLERLDGVLLSHAHLDHSGHIAFLKREIPVYSTAMTAFIAKAIQDSGSVSFDQRVCYFGPSQIEAPSGWKQEGCLSQRDEANVQRQFCLGDRGLESLSQEALDFWEEGFWEKSPKEKKLASCPLNTLSGSALNLRCLPVDHSIPGACAWAVETSTGWVAYTGDLRFHGKRANLSRQFVEEAARLRPHVLLTEGTYIDRQRTVTEEEVHQNALKAVRQAPGLVIADFAARDVDRLLTFLAVAEETGRKLVVLPKDAYLLKTVRLLDPDVPDVSTAGNLHLYQKTTGDRSPELWQRRIYRDYEGKTILAQDIRASQDDFILCFSFFDLNELPSLQPREGSLYLYSSSEPHNEEQEIDFRRLHRWLERFGIRSFGLPREVRPHHWEIPEEEQGLHASGHGSGPGLLDMIRRIAPKVLVPIHTTQAEEFREGLQGTGIEVRVPEESLAMSVS